MSMVIVLDTGPVGMITNPNASATNRECYQRKQTQEDHKRDEQWNHLPPPNCVFSGSLQTAPGRAGR